LTGNIPDAIAALTGFLTHPINPPPAARDTAAKFAFRKNIRPFMVQLPI
jgi:hypothetical protein